MLETRAWLQLLLLVLVRLLLTVERHSAVANHGRSLRRFVVFVHVISSVGVG